MISTKNIQSGGDKISKVLEPGNTEVKINRVYLDRVPWSEEAYNLMYDCEGPDLGEAFQGFNVDRDNPEAGKFKGQVGRVRSSRWTFEDKTINDIEFSRDLEILKNLKYLCDAIDCADWLSEQDNKHETIESLVDKLNADKPYKDKFMKACIAGKEYQNKDGYTNFDLFFPKFSKSGVPYESMTIDADKSRVSTFSDTEHIIKFKPKTVEGFAPEDKPAVVDEFDLD
jgi:hypothetical protein